MVEAQLTIFSELEKPGHDATWTMDCFQFEGQAVQNVEGLAATGVLSWSLVVLLFVEVEGGRLQSIWICRLPNIGMDNRDNVQQVLTWIPHTLRRT